MGRFPIPRNTTYGYETEWQTGAQQLNAKLYEDDLVGDPALHGWHCDCETCDFAGEFPFRGQTDSTCSGEIISTVLHTSPGLGAWNPEDLARKLTDAALAVDAEPGLNSGFHVHVGMAGVSIEQRAEALWAFLRWEPLLVRLAAGRWDSQRSMNESVRDQTNFDLDDLCGMQGRSVTSNMMLAEAGELDRPLDDLRFRLHDHHYRNDRHSNLSIRTRHDTWEFRLWNSTRSLWRLNLWTWLSVAMTDPDVVRALNDISFPQRIGAQTSTRFADILQEAGYPRTADAVERQARYLRERAGEAPSSLTIL